MNPNSTTFGGQMLVPYESRNIRLSSALWAMQFVPRVDAEPATLVIDVETKKPTVSFWHEHSLPPEAPVYKTFIERKSQLHAEDVGLWWSDPGKYSIEGYDDALRAIRRVHERREWLIGVIKGKFRIRGDNLKRQGSVGTESLHVASCINACGFELAAFEKRTFLFNREAAPVATLIYEAAKDSPRRQLNADGLDYCVDWMYVSLVCRDKLMGFVRQCIAQIEQRDGDRV